MRAGSWSDGIGVSVRRDTREFEFSLCTCTRERPCEHMVRRWPSASQGGSSHQSLTSLAPQSQSSSTFLVVSHPVYGTLSCRSNSLRQKFSILQGCKA